MAREDPCQIVGQTTDVRGNRHFVVVQDDQHVGAQMAGVIERFVGHACRHGAIADDGCNAPMFTSGAGTQCHPERGTDGGAGMPDPEAVERTLRALWEGRQPVQLADGGQGLARPVRILWG